MAPTMTKPPRFWGNSKRYLVVSLTCWGMLVIHAIRVNMAVTVVALVDAKHDAEPLNNDYEPVSD